MAHKTLVGGTAYEIGGGKDLIGGTVYEKDHGKTLVGGTAYEVGFVEPVTVTIKGAAKSSGYAYIVIDGTTYDGFTCGNISLSVPVGTVIYCHTDWDSKDVKYGIYLNGTWENGNSYQYAATTNVTMSLETSEGKYEYGGLIYITEK